MENIKSIVTSQAIALICVTFWGVANAIVFGVNFSYFNTSDEYSYQRRLIGNGLAWARSSAACLNLNCMLLIFPICRNLLLSISLILKCNYSINKQLWWNLHYHKLFASAIIVFSFIHAFVHCINFAHLYDSRLSHDPLISILTHLPNNGSELNPIQDLSHGMVYQTLRSIPGTSGILLVVILIVIVTTSIHAIRRSYYELFWYSHHLFVFFYALLLIHGIQGVLKKQTNIEENDPELCYLHPQVWGQDDRCKIPLFTSNPPQTWKWILLPVLLYMLERFIRFIRSWQEVTIVKVLHHPSSVLELQMRKVGFKFRTGQYVYIQCPKISFFEWHPFTLTSAPEDNYFSVHIRQAGDWTEQLISKFSHQENADRLSFLPRIAVDGPYGTPSERVFSYRTVMLIGAGIGVNPFASVLKSFLRKPPHKLKEIHFYWLCPQPQAFEWFAEMLHRLEQQLIAAGNINAVQYHIYLTRGWNLSQAWNIFLHEGETTDTITGLKQKTNYGRPNWDTIFETMKTTYLRQTIGVFCCGPKTLSSVLFERCKIYSSSNSDGVCFEFHKENF